MNYVNYNSFKYEKDSKWLFHTEKLFLEKPFVNLNDLIFEMFNIFIEYHNVMPHKSSVRLFPTFGDFQI